MNVCQVVGRRGLNSTDAFPTGAVALCFLKADHIRPAKINTPTILIKLPEDLMTFHVEKASG